MISSIGGLELRELVIAKPYPLLVGEYFRWDIGDLLVSSVAARPLAVNIIGIA